MSEDRVILPPITGPTPLVRTNRIQMPEGGWRNPLVVILVGALSVMTFAVIGLCTALWSATTARNDLSDQLDCNRSFAAEVDDKLADAITALASSAAVNLEGLAATQGGPGSLPEILSTVPAILESLTNSSSSLEAATAARSRAVETCN